MQITCIIKKYMLYLYQDKKTNEIGENQLCF
ncbi:hypothetical protein Alsa1_CDS0225 [Staphylococcus phage Alsa_1]|nr:hypothetical protein Alsa1_CDS0225 [Staphylococcus phage Alsa_1]WNM50814.1 hypothetical protein Alsa2_CDS0200 [Staphylococcus phage Alsa_2]WNM50945.1 hypothetical protein Alsa3_CDS0076 [Staphylococcus phage Alsa_3]WNM51199.1 hypothetical protein Alsa4_CDS0069 [Staphylococcus phage Alsa_4]WNM56101.1 hypothetical protein CoNPh38_CDS0225 [Staphylococcus phage S-CoN_Ph38]